MSAWYIFSAMGFYPVNPCNSVYVLGTPFVEKATISLGSGKKFVIKTKDLSAENKYIQSVILNGKPYHKTWIRHTDIVSGGTLIFNMSKEPNKEWGTSKDAIPPAVGF